MKINANKLYESISWQLRLPRKVKKHILGKRMSKSKLKALLKTVVVHSNAKTMYDSPQITPYLFCPNCGCRQTRSSGNLTCYPEHWEKEFCLRCNTLVGYIDNSPYSHALEYPEDNYDPSF